jgi:molybdopterin/thiamine biosynthesis adenylyltransferase
VTTEPVCSTPALPLPWWEQWQGRVGWEIDCFERWDLPVTVLEDPRAGANRLVLESQARLDDGSSTRVVVVYPASFPHQPFTVYAPDLSLPRHQSPDGNLCLYARGDGNWHPTYAAADAVADRVPYLVRLVNAGGDLLRENEDPQGEPASAYYGSVLEGGIVVDARALTITPQEGEHGDLGVAFTNNSADWLNQVPPSPEATSWAPATGQGFLVSASSPLGTTLDDPDPTLTARYGPSVMQGKWLYLGQPPLVGTADELWQACFNRCPDIERWTDGTTGHQLIGLCFDEELQQSVYGIGWVFLHRVVTETKAHGKGPRGGKSGRPQSNRPVRKATAFQVVRGLRWDDDALTARIPELAPLRTKTAAIVGLGSLGAPVALELAKERIHTLKVLDRDFLDTGNAVRHPLGLDYAGQHKVVAVGRAAHMHNPETQVLPRITNIGHGTLTDKAVTDEAFLQDLLAGSDLLISATAEEDVNRYLDNIALQMNVARLYLWSQSGYGGVVALLREGSTGCYHCLNLLLSDLAEAGTPAVAVPEDVDNAVTIQGPGCADQTFTATHADLLPISLQAVRVANGVLCGPEGGYPEFNDDVFTVQIREPDGTPIPPRWTSHKLPPNPTCPICHPA